MSHLTKISQQINVKCRDFNAAQGIEVDLIISERTAALLRRRSISEMHEKTGIQKHRLEMLEKGTVPPSMGEIIQLANAIDCGVEMFTAGIDEIDDDYLIEKYGDAA